MAFNLEDKISYQELSRGLKDILDNMKNECEVNQKNTIGDIYLKIDEFLKRLEEIANSVTGKHDEDIFGSVATDDKTSDGQVIKINPPVKKVYPHDEYLEKRVVDNDEDLAEEFTRIPDSMETIFNSWYIFAHYNAWATSLLDKSNHGSGNNGQNKWNESPFSSEVRGVGWAYDRTNNMICHLPDSECTTGFIAPEKRYYNYYIKMLIDTGWDDDNLQFVVGFTTDENGVEHTLQVVRGFMRIEPNDQDCLFAWGLIYDMGNASQYIIINYTDKPGMWPAWGSDWGGRDAGNHSTNYCYMTITKVSSQITCRTSDWSKDGKTNTEPNPAWDFTYKFPETKPADWSDEMYENMRKMMTETTQIGFGARSGTPRFTILDQSGIFDDTDIYALHQNIQYYFNYYENAWQPRQKVTDNADIVPRIFLYNKFLKQLYFYYDINFNWVKIQVKSDGKVDLDSLYDGAVTGQLMKYNKDSGNILPVYFSDEVLMRKAIESDNDINIMNNNSEGFTFKDVIDRWDRIEVVDNSNRDIRVNTSKYANDMYYYDEDTKSICVFYNYYRKTVMVSQQKFGPSFKIKTLVNMPLMIQKWPDQNSIPVPQPSQEDIESTKANYGTVDDDAIVISLAVEFDENRNTIHDLTYLRVGALHSWQYIHGQRPDFEDQWCAKNNAFSAIVVDWHRWGGWMNGASGGYNNWNNNAKILVQRGPDIIEPMAWNQGTIYMQVEKDDKTIICYTSNPNDKDIIEASKITWTLPNSKPSNLTDEQWEFVQRAMKQPSKIGFGTMSNPCMFNLVSYEGFLTDSPIYDLPRKQVYDIIDNVKTNIQPIESKLENKVILYNQFTKKMFWYDNKNSWMRLFPGNYKQ